VGAAFCVAGAVITQLWAPETAGRSLLETSGAGDRRSGAVAGATS
jgi:hypothetical protein